MTTTTTTQVNVNDYEISLIPYKNEKLHLEILTNLIQDELSEPYIIYTYRYFLNQWPHLCFLAYAKRKSRSNKNANINTNTSISTKSSSEPTNILPISSKNLQEENQDEDESENENGVPIGVIVSKLDRHLKGDRLMRGYIAMLSVDSKWRRKGVASLLVKSTLKSMIENGAQEVVLETEVDNSSSLALYQHLGFIKEKRLYRFYLNGKDCFRLILPIPQELQRMT